MASKAKTKTVVKPPASKRLITISVPVEMNDALRKMAKEQRRPLSNMIQKIVADVLAAKAVV